MKNINIVYFAWINILKNWKNIIGGQFRDIINSKILDHSKIYIIITCEHNYLIDEVKNLFTSLLEKYPDYEYEIEFHRLNIYEFFGIKKLYQLSKNEPEKYYLYIHSKGIFNYGNIDTRHNNELTLTKGTVYLHKYIIKKFEENNDIKIIGLFPSIEGSGKFVWFNFFWTKGDYLQTCKKPIQTDDRFYYEKWLATGDDVLIYNLYENNFKKYRLDEAGDILNSLKGTFPLEKYK